MAKVDANTVSGFKTELDVFSLPATQVSVEKGYFNVYYCQNPVTNTGPYRIHVPKDSFMIDLNKNYLYLRLRIVTEGNEGIQWPVRADGNADESTVKCAPVNYLGATFFERVILKVGDKEVENSGNLYAYKALLETLLNFGNDAKQSHLQLGLFYKDKAGKFENLNSGAAVSRGKAFHAGNPVELLTPLHCDLFKQEKYMLNDVDITIELHRNEDKFLLISDGTPYKIIVEDLRWYVYRVKPQESLSLAIENLLQNNTAKYPVRRVKLATRHFAPLSQSVVESSIFSGQLPRRVLVVFVDSEAFNGSFRKNPFRFAHCGISEIALKFGDELIPKFPTKIEWRNYGYSFPYLSLCEACDTVKADKGFGISYEDFRDGYSIFAFDLTPDQVDAGALGLLRDGDLSLHLQFRHPLDAAEFSQGVEAIIYGEFDNLVSLDAYRTPFFDYAI